MITFNDVLSMVDRISKSRVQSSILQPDSEAINRLVNIQNITGKDPEFIPLTPYGKNAAIAIDKNEDGNKIKLSQPTMKWEAYVIKESVSIYKKHHQINVKDYIETSPDNYYSVDARRNLDKIGREVTPDAYLRRRKSFDQYFETAKTLKFSPDTKLFEKAMNIIASEFGINKVPHTDSWPRGKVPFQNYHTNVGWRHFVRDNVSIKGLTGEQLSLRDAKKIELNDIHNLPAMGIGRDQRSGFELGDNLDLVNNLDVISNKTLKILQSKARAVWATSRTGNYWLAKIVMNMINWSKQTNLFVGFNDRETIKQAFAKMKTAESKFKICWRNTDFKGWDYHLSTNLLAAGSLVLKEACSTVFGKQLIEEACLWAAKMPLLKTGPNLELRYKNGALPSGILTTNLLGGIINAVVSTYALLKLYPDFENLISKFRLNGIPWMLVMGDDNLSILRKLEDADKFNEILINDFSIEANPKKGEAGIFFLQMRYDHKRDVLLTPFPRVISKCFWIERPKGLGQYGWTLATWMKLYNIKDNIEFNDVVKLICQFDKSKLGLVNTETNKQQSFNEFRANLNSESQAMAMSSLERVGTGNPNDDIFFKISTGNVKSLFLEEMWNKVSEAILHK